jgi:type II secretory pathway pseudopilin PulG
VRTEPSLVHRAGFTAIEMMVVVSIIILLVAMVVPTIGPAIKKGSVHDAASAIQRACSQARQLARSTTEPRPAGAGGSISYFGVAIVVPPESGGKTPPAYAVVVYNDANLTSYSEASSLSKHYPNGVRNYDGTIVSVPKAAAKFEFNKGVMPFADTSVTGTPAYAFMNPGTSVGWYYQYRTGFVFTDPTKPTKAVDVGVIGGAAPMNLGVATLDKKYMVAVAVYKIGLLNAQDIH